MRLSRRSRSVSLRDEANDEVAPGEAGEICVRGPHTMERYWKRPEQTESVRRRLAAYARRRAGNLYIVDRKKDMIVPGGFQRSSTRGRGSHPDVAMAAVIGVPHEKWARRSPP